MLLIYIHGEDAVVSRAQNSVQCLLVRRNRLDVIDLELAADLLEDLAQLEVQVVLDDAQGELVVLGDAGEVGESQAAEEAVDFGAHVLGDFDDGAARQVGRQRGLNLMFFKKFNFFFAFFV